MGTEKELTLIKSVLTYTKEALDEQTRCCNGINLDLVTGVLDADEFEYINDLLITQRNMHSVSRESVLIIINVDNTSVVNNSPGIMPNVILDEDTTISGYCQNISDIIYHIEGAIHRVHGIHKTAFSMYQRVSDITNIIAKAISVSFPLFNLQQTVTMEISADCKYCVIKVAFSHMLGRVEDLFIIDDNGILKYDDRYIRIKHI